MLWRVTMIVRGTSSFWYLDVEAASADEAVELVEGMGRFPSSLVSVRQL